MHHLTVLLAVVAAYLVGSLSFAVIVTRVMGLSDPRTYGSKNPGATNVLRSGSKKAAAVTLALDAAKGWLPVALVMAWGADYGVDSTGAALVAIAAFCGHVWPVFFRFVGGKGVATALGVLLGVSGWLGLAVLLVWVSVVALMRYSSLGALVAAIAAPALYVAGDGRLWMASLSMTMAISAMGLLLLWRHQANIVRLYKGTEPKLGRKSAAL